MKSIGHRIDCARDPQLKLGIHPRRKKPGSKSLYPGVESDPRRGRVATLPDLRVL